MDRRPPSRPCSAGPCRGQRKNLPASAKRLAKAFYHPILATFPQTHPADSASDRDHLQALRSLLGHDEDEEAEEHTLLRSDPFLELIPMDFGFGLVASLCSYGVRSDDLDYDDGLRLDDLYLFEEALRLDLLLTEKEKLRRWNQRLDWENLHDHAEQKFVWAKMVPFLRGRIGCLEQGYWHSKLFLSDAPIMDFNMGYYRVLVGQDGLFHNNRQFLRLRDYSTPHYPLVGTLKDRYPFWRDGGFGLGKCLLRWLPAPKPLAAPSSFLPTSMARFDSLLSPSAAVPSGSDPLPDPAPVAQDPLVSDFDRKLRVQQNLTQLVQSVRAQSSIHLPASAFHYLQRPSGPRYAGHHPVLSASGPPIYPYNHGRAGLNRLGMRDHLYRGVAPGLSSTFGQPVTSSNSLPTRQTTHAVGDRQPSKPQQKTSGGFNLSHPARLRFPENPYDFQDDEILIKRLIKQENSNDWGKRPTAPKAHGTSKPDPSNPNAPAKSRPVRFNLEPQEQQPPEAGSHDPGPSSSSRKPVVTQGIPKGPKLPQPPKFARSSDK